MEPARQNPRMNRILLAACLLCATPLATAAEPARVVIVGTYHFANPGQDLHNVDAVDVTMPERQAELQAVTDALARFEPNVVAVEWPAAKADVSYARYLDGTLPPTANEVVQLGFRLARKRGLSRVHGIDVPGEFPYEDVQAWAMANGRQQDLEAQQREIQAIVEGLTALQGKHTIFGEVADQAGRDVVDKIAAVPTARGDKPLDDVVIESVEVQRS